MTSDFAICIPPRRTIPKGQYHDADQSLVGLLVAAMGKVDAFEARPVGAPSSPHAASCCACVTLAHLLRHATPPPRGSVGVGQAVAEAGALEATVALLSSAVPAIAGASLKDKEGQVEEEEAAAAAAAADTNAAARSRKRRRSPTAQRFAELETLTQQGTSALVLLSRNTSVQQRAGASAVAALADLLKVLSDTIEAASPR